MSERELAGSPIWVNDFTEASAKTFAKEVLEASADEDKPIIVYIDSYGGQVYALATMVAALGTVSNKVITVCVGKAMSCGAILLSCGEERYIDIDSTVMIHEVSGGFRGNVKDIEVEATEMRRLNDRWMTRLAQNCGKSLEELEALFRDKREIYMTAPDAIEFGLVDKIGIPKLYKVTSYELA